MIRVIYLEEPDFPPTDNHPDAQRAFIGGYFVDYIGSVTEQDVLDLINLSKGIV